jgi:hypothetical protein
MNFVGLQLPIIGGQPDATVKRIYSHDEIKNTTKVKLFFNETLVDIQCQNNNFDKCEENYQSNKISSLSNEIYFPLSAKISILIKMKDLKLILEKYNEEYFDMDSISSRFEDRIISFSDGKAAVSLKGEIHSKNIKELINPGPLDFVLGDEDRVGYSVNFYRPNVKLQIVDKSNSGLSSNEIMLQAFNSMDEEGQIYYMFGTHLFNKNLISKARLSEFELMTDLIMRVMGVFDIPLNTHCNEKTSYSIMINDDNIGFDRILMRPH